TLQWTTSLTSNQYDGISPDRFKLVGSYNSGDLTTAELPNATRKLFWQLKFDTAALSGPSGQVLFDSVRNNPSDRIEFRDLAGTRIRVNFINSVFTITATDVRDINPAFVPRQFALFQNYPNPSTPAPRLFLPCIRPDMQPWKFSTFLGRK
ncbi:MAG: hypothetical protein L0209_11855, partial [candidate division Zixibacteria bacterium]|nr:hypothetical protein [candidate division Zixibacteria bacterium]